MTPVYIAPEVRQILDLHQYLTENAFKKSSIREQIAIQAGTIHAAHGKGDTRIGMHVMSWWPKALGKTLDQVLTSEFSASDAVITMCCEYGFSDWDAVNGLGDLILDPQFEGALDHMLAGEIDDLGTLLDQSPDLVVAQTRLGHRSTLLHYIGANGVESHRQKTPLNPAAIAELLVAKGASKMAEANMYGGAQTPYTLASTSAHPRNAGISDDLNLALQTG